MSEFVLPAPAAVVYRYTWPDADGPVVTNHRGNRIRLTEAVVTEHPGTDLTPGVESIGLVEGRAHMAQIGGRPVEEQILAAHRSAHTDLSVVRDHVDLSHGNQHPWIPGSEFECAALCDALGLERVTRRHWRPGCHKGHEVPVLEDQGGQGSAGPEEAEIEFHEPR